jgi:hypothetical protein
MKSRSPIVSPLLQPGSVVFGLAVVDFTLMLVRDSRIGWEFIDYHGYYADTYEALVLLIAALFLLLNRFWTCPIAALLATRTIYIHVFLTLRGISNAHDTSIFSVRAWTHWLFVLRLQPQYALHLTLAVLIFALSALSVVASVRRRSGHGVEQIVERPAG